jgi:hypothetical protein
VVLASGFGPRFRLVSGVLIAVAADSESGARKLMKSRRMSRQLSRRDAAVKQLVKLAAQVTHMRSQPRNLLRDVGQPGELRSGIAPSSTLPILGLLSSSRVSSNPIQPASRIISSSSHSDSHISCLSTIIDPCRSLAIAKQGERKTAHESHGLP